MQIELIPYLNLLYYDATRSLFKISYNCQPKKLFYLIFVQFFSAVITESLSMVQMCQRNTVIDHCQYQND